MAAIILQDLGKIHPNGYEAVRQLTLAVADGELLVLVGPSGSGKSTVLRLIAGLETPTSGRILIGGRDVSRDPPQRRDVAMVFQSYALYPHKTVRENMAFGLRVRGVSGGEIEARVTKAAKALGIESLLHRKPAQLSGGQRQRAALGRAIVREPQAFLFDEPLSNLDPVLRHDTRTELALLHRQLGATTIYVTHDQEEAMTLGTRVAVMRQGLVEQVAPPLDVFRRPVNVFVASFLGSPAMNLWPAAVVRIPDGLRISSPIGRFVVDGRYAPTVEDGDLTVGLRAHDFALVSADEADGSGEVVLVEPIGSSTVVHLSVEGLPNRFVRVVATADVSLSQNDRLHFRLRRDRVHLFDARSGAAIYHGSDHDM